MFDWFSSKPTPKEQQRAADKQLRRSGRDIEREIHHLELEENKLEEEIKRLAKKGNKEECKILAKQLISVRKQKQRGRMAAGRITSIGQQNKAMGANAKLADAISIAGDTMADMNKLMKPEEIGAAMNNFSRESAKMDMTDEMINSTLDDMLTESGDEEESDNIVSKVLDEIGIEISGKMANVPSPQKGKIGENSKVSDVDLEAQLAKLRG